MLAWLIASAMFRAYTNKQLGKSGKRNLSAFIFSYLKSSALKRKMIHKKRVRSYHFERIREMTACTRSEFQELIPSQISFE